MGYENYVYLAKLAEQAERYEGTLSATPFSRRLCIADHSEMVENMKNVASADQELSVEERNLLSVAYKNVIGARRASWRIVTSIEQKEESKGNEGQAKLIKEYRQKIEAELAGICRDILEVLDKHLIQSAKTGESKVFYHKMCTSHDLPVFWRIRLLIIFTGRAIIIVISPNLLLATSARTLPTSRWKLTRRQPRSLRLILLRLILFASD